MYSRAHARLLKEDHGLALLDAPRVRAPITDEHATTDDLEIQQLAQVMDGATWRSSS